MDPYVVISCDCHAGAATPDFKPYLPRAPARDFDAVVRGVPPTASVPTPRARALRHRSTFRDLEADVRADVIYPNTSHRHLPASSTAHPTTRSASTATFGGKVARVQPMGRHCVTVALIAFASMAQISLHTRRERSRDPSAHEADCGAASCCPVSPGSPGPPYHDLSTPDLASVRRRGMTLTSRWQRRTSLRPHPGSTIIFPLSGRMVPHRASRSSSSGVLERHPNLRTGEERAGAGWYPHLAVLDR